MRYFQVLALGVFSGHTLPHALSADQSNSLPTWDVEASHRVTVNLLKTDLPHCQHPRAGTALTFPSGAVPSPASPPILARPGTDSQQQWALALWNPCQKGTVCVPPATRLPHTVCGYGSLGIKGTDLVGVAQ